MKKLYLTLFLTSIALLVFWAVSIPPIQSELTLIDRLALHKDRWNITLNDPDTKAFPEKDLDIKTKVLDLLQKQRSSHVNFNIAIILIISTIYSLIGWRRESYFERMQTEQDAAANP